MKKYIYLAIALLFVGLAVFAWYESMEARTYKELYGVSAANEKAYNEALSDSKEKARVFQLTINNLKCSNDSLVAKLLEVQKDRKIKDKQIKSLSYQLATASKRDTLILRDIIFAPTVAIDTTLGDKWYNLNLHLEYPSTVAVEPTFQSEKYVLISSKRETVDPPSKCFFIRWFQRKHEVITVDVEEKNPYIQTTQQKFIEIVK